MENKPKTKIVLRPGSPVVKVLLAVMLAASVVALTAVYWVRGEVRRQTEQKRQEAAALEQENADLTQRSQDIDSVESIKAIAESELGLVSPDAVIIGEE